MAEESDSVWPSVDVSDSEEEVETNHNRNLPLVDNKPPVSEEEINGDFPVLKLNKESDESSSDDEDEAKPVKKINPYLTTSGDDIKAKYNEKLRSLHMKRNEARKMNHQEVSAEDQRNKLPANYEAMKRRAEWELADKTAREVCITYYAFDKLPCIWYMYIF